MNIIEKYIQQIDLFQQKHPALSFPIAVIKKVGDDNAGYQAALITYYGFLSLFPLLLVATSIVGILSLGNDAVEASVMESVGDYFPVIGEQLSRNIQASTKSGAALVVGLVIAFYGTRGGADAFRNAINHLWHVPRKKRTGFPQNILKSFCMTLFGGIGLTAAAMLSAYTASLGKSFIFTVLAALMSLLLLIPTFYFLYWISLPRNYTEKGNLLCAAITSGVSVVILQAIGGYLVTNQLKTLSPLYGTFAIVLGLLFWIYLQALAVLYAVAITVVIDGKQWPRSITGRHLTTADKKLGV
jgi:YihY family inner membrane protein